MAGILKIKDAESGAFVEIPAIKGATGPQGPKGDTGPQGPKGDSIGVVTATIYPNENFIYPIPSPVNKENIISIALQSWTKTGGYPSTCIFVPVTLGGVYGFEAIGFSAAPDSLSPYNYGNDTTKGVTVKIYYNVG